MSLFKVRGHTSKSITRYVPRLKRKGEYSPFCYLFIKEVVVANICTIICR